MFTGNPADTTRAEQPGGISPAVHSVLAVFSSKEPRHRNKSDGRGINISGVDFWHAVEFSRNGRFLCTHPRDSLVAFLRALPFGLAFPTLSDRFRDPIPCRRGLPKAWAFAVGLSTFTTLADSRANS